MHFCKIIFFSILILGSVSFSEAVFSDSDSASQYLQQGHAKLHEGKIDEAIGFYQKSLAAKSDYQPAKNSLESALQTKEILKFADKLPAECRKGSNPSWDNYVAPSFSESLSCAQRYFTMFGEPINSRIVRELLAWESDGGDVITAINLREAQQSNRFFQEDEKITITPEGSLFTVRSEQKPKNKADDNDDSDGFPPSFTYKIEGVMPNGIFLISTSEEPAGDYDSGRLLIVRITKESGFSLNGSVPERVLLQKLAEYSGTPHKLLIKGNQATWVTGENDAHSVKVSG